MGGHFSQVKGGALPKFFGGSCQKSPPLRQKSTSATVILLHKISFHFCMIVAFKVKQVSPHIFENANRLIIKPNIRVEEQLDILRKNKCYEDGQFLVWQHGTIVLTKSMALNNQYTGSSHVWPQRLRRWKAIYE